MNTKKRIIPALVFSLFATLGSAPAQSAQFSNVYVFGDSLSDAGYFRPFLTSLGLPASLVATLGRFTINPGPVWSELVSTHYGVATPGPSNAGGNIFAQGGARVALPSASTPPGSAQRPVSTQIDEFLGRGPADPNALYAVWGGANDLLQNFALFSAGQITQAQLQANILAAATAEVGQIARLRAAGARYILVFGLPDVGGTPASAAGGPAAVGAATALSAGFNTTLFTGLQSSGLRVIPVDTFGLFTDVRTNAAAFGFTNTTGLACLPFPPITTTPSSQFCTAGNIQPGGQGYLFADSVHPTPAAHAILGDYVNSLIDAPSQYSYLPETALRARQSHVRSISSGSAAGAGLEIGKFTVFVAADGGDFEIEAGQGLNGQRTDNSTFALGVQGRVSEGVTVGAAVGRSKAKAHFEGGGGYQLEENTLSLFTSARAGGLYGRAVLSIGDADYNETRRELLLGGVRRTFEARPQGNNASLFADLGYDFSLGAFKIGPVVGLASQNVTVNQFDETPAGGAPITGALTLYEQKRRSEIWSVGGRASFDWGNWTPFVRITADKDRRDDDRFVTAGVRSLGAIGATYDIPAYKPDSTFLTTYIGVRGNFSPWIGVGLTYFNVSSREGIKEDGIAGAVAIRF